MGPLPVAAVGARAVLPVPARAAGPLRVLPGLRRAGRCAAAALRTLHTAPHQGSLDPAENNLQTVLLQLIAKCSPCCTTDHVMLRRPTSRLRDLEDATTLGWSLAGVQTFNRELVIQKPHQTLRRALPARALAVRGRGVPGEEVCRLLGGAGAAAALRARARRRHVPRREAPGAHHPRQLPGARACPAV